MSILDSLTKKKKDAPAKKRAAKEKAVEAETTESSASVVASTAGGALAYRILLKPIFTEKSSREESMGKYTFIVANSANKVEVARAIKELYGVKPVSVRISVLEGKAVAFGRSLGREKTVKKAIVTVPKGASLTLVQG